MPFTLATFVIAVGCAAISYYVVERPFLALKDRRRWRRLRPATDP